MNKIKLLGFLVLVVLLTGCTGKYKVNILQDGKIEEKFEMTFNTSSIEVKDIDKYIKDTIKQYRDNDMYVNYNIKKDTSKTKSTIYATRKYSNLNDYITNSELLPVLFEKTLPNGDYDIKGLFTTGEYYKTSIFSDDFDGETFDKIDVEVKSMFDFVSNNADKFDKESNTLYWYITNDKNNFSISFQFNNSKRYDIIIKEFIKNIIPAVIIIVIVSIITLIIYKTLKNKDNLNNEI